jgi:hypothetical protein
MHISTISQNKQYPTLTTKKLISKNQQHNYNNSIHKITNNMNKNHHNNNNNNKNKIQNNNKIDIKI